MTNTRRQNTQNTTRTTRHASCIRDTNEATLRKATSLANSAYRKYRHAWREWEETSALYGAYSPEWKEAEQKHNEAELAWEDADRTRTLVAEWCEYWEDSEWDCDCRLTETKLADLHDTYTRLMRDGYMPNDARMEAVSIVAGA